MEKIILVEEISPATGYTKEEIETTLWNSPPSEKGQGRYRIVGKNINPQHFSALRSKNLVWFWDEEFLEECDMFFVIPGWRTNAEGINFLREHQYDIDIDTLLAQKERADKRKKEKAQKEQKKITRIKLANEKYQNEIEEYESWLGNPEYHDQGDYGSGGESMHLKCIQNTEDEYRQYSIFPKNNKYYLFLHVHINFDWWNNMVSNDPVPDYVINSAKKIKADRDAQAEKEKLEREIKIKAEHDFLRPYLQTAVDRVGGIEQLEKIMKKSKQQYCCPRELQGKKDGRNYNFTVSEIKSIIGIRDCED